MDIDNIPLSPAKMSADDRPSPTPDGSAGNTVILSPIRKAKNRAGQSIQRSKPSRPSRPSFDAFLHVKGGMKRRLTNPEGIRGYDSGLERSDTSNSLDSISEPVTPSKKGAKAQVKAASDNVINNKRRKIKPSHASGLDTPQFSKSSNVSDPVPKLPQNPWALDERSNTAPFTPIKKGKLKQGVPDDVLTCITPQKRVQSLDHLRHAPSRHGSSEHTPLSPTKFTVSPASPTIMGLCDRTFENWVVGEVNSSPISPTSKPRYGNQDDDEMLLGGGAEETFVATTPGSVHGPPVFRGVRGASTGLPLGPTVENWRDNKIRVVKRASSHGFDDVFGPSVPPTMVTPQLTRKKGGLLKEKGLNKTGKSHNTEDEEMISL